VASGCRAKPMDCSVSPCPLATERRFSCGTRLRGCALLAQVMAKRCPLARLSFAFARPRPARRRPDLAPRPAHHRAPARMPAGPPHALAREREPPPADQPEHRRRRRARQPELHPGNRAPGRHHGTGSACRPVPRRSPASGDDQLKARPSVRDQRPCGRGRRPAYRAPPGSAGPAFQKQVNRGRLRFVNKMGGSDAARAFSLP